MNSLQIPDFSTNVDFGVGKASISLTDFTVESFAFFPDEDVLVSNLPPNQINMNASGANIVASVDYNIKLLTYPYSSLVGAARLTVGELGAFASASIGISPDYSDVSCDVLVSNLPPNQINMNASGANIVASVDYNIKLLTYPYSSLVGAARLTVGELGAFASASIGISPDYSDVSCGKEACGYLPDINIDTLKLELDDIHIDFIGDVNPILEMIKDVLQSSLIPFLSSTLSNAIAEYISSQGIHDVLGLNSSYHFDTYNVFNLGFAQAAYVGPSYFTLPTFAVGCFGKTANDKIREDSVDPTYNPPSSLPYDMFSSELSFTISDSSVHSIFYNSLHNSNASWSDLKGTFTNVACISTRDGCFDSDGNYSGGYSSQYLIRNNLGIDIDNPPSDLSPIFTSHFWMTIIPDLYSLCSNCYIDIGFTFQTIDGVPVVPDISTRLDGMDLAYDDMEIVLSLYQVDSGDSVASVGLTIDLATLGIMWSDHAYINFLQTVESVTAKKISSCIEPNQQQLVDSDTNTDNFNTDSVLVRDPEVLCAGVTLTEWEMLAYTLSVAFLDEMFTTTFMQQERGFNYLTRMPLGFYFVCTFADESIYYMPDDGCTVVSVNFSECACDVKAFDDKSRNEDGTVYCLQDMT
ncbi:hypothetical protein ADUPG1_006562 [Aduncisulcus paluster]|uniref:Lipid-binding serum glycoprotein C-terminal domain-containing protein n=1 Tax=Aduncisulcus paluster TaxID=2918883 RepID=A0ABQ5KIP6_9EUKA|nr:hypothetical protein ADUPG1_006562 [Aduncisulcus paluster]